LRTAKKLQARSLTERTVPMTRFTILFVAILLAVHGQRALAQEKDQAKPKASQQAPLPFDVADWSTKQLLEHYDPAESDNKVGRELERRGKGKRFIVFNKDRSADVGSSEFLFKELRKGFPEREWFEVAGTLRKTYKVGTEPGELLDENPLYPGQALRLDETCQKTNRKWQGVPLIVRQVLYLAITDSKELKIERVADAHEIMDKIKGKTVSDSEAWLKERYPQAFREYGEKKDRNQLPILKISSDKAKSGQAEPNKGGATTSGPKILRHKTGTWKGSQDNYANYSDLAFDIGIGNRRDGKGFGNAGVEIENVRNIALSVERSPPYQHIDANSFAGFMVDYHTSEGYVKRVALGAGMIDYKRFSKAPWWGRGARPDKFVRLGQHDTYVLDLEKWAPQGWDGKVWFTVSVENTGRQTNLKVKAALPSEKH
jgi:hypothetical protein